MQVLNLDAELNISRLDADIRTLRLGEGGTTNYNDLTNKPSINSVTLTGNKTTSDLNIKTSDLVNDAGFITNADIPTKTSDLINDDGFQTAAQVSTAVAAAIPTEVSAFTNDAGYITAAQVGNIPTKTSDLDNDSGFITSAQAPVQSVNGYTGTVTIDGNNVNYSAGVTVNEKIDTVENSIPTKTSDIVNDSGFITAVSIPTNVSSFNNDAGYITSAQAPVQTVQGKTGNVRLYADLTYILLQGNTTAVFDDLYIYSSANQLVDIFCTEWGVVPDDVNMTITDGVGVITVSFDQAFDHDITILARVYFL